MRNMQGAAMEGGFSLMTIDKLIKSIENICQKGQVNASKNRIRLIRILIGIYKEERGYPWYLKVALYFYEKR